MIRFLADVTATIIGAIGATCAVIWLYLAIELIGG